MNIIKEGRSHSANELMYTLHSFFGDLDHHLPPELSLNSWGLLVVHIQLRDCENLIRGVGSNTLRND